MYKTPKSTSFSCIKYKSLRHAYHEGKVLYMLEIQSDCK